LDTFNSAGIDWNFILDCSIKIVASVVCGFILGIERKSRSQAVGIRTLVLICVSSTLLSILSIYIPLVTPKQTDSSRIIAGVVSGIGFLGGGAIMRQGMNIKGLTSAAIIWTAAALGMALGAGLYIQTALVLVVVELILILIAKMERKLFPDINKKGLHLVFEGESVDITKIREAIEKKGIRICDQNMTRDISHEMLILHFSINISTMEDFEPLIQELTTMGNLTEFSITD